MNTPVVVAEGLTRSFARRGAPALLAVDDASFQVWPGEVFGLLGPNGAGKTTTLRMLAGLIRPTAGRASLCGHDVVREPLRARTALGYLSATSGLPTRVTCRECLRAFATLQGVGDVVATVDEALDRFAVRDFAERFVEDLSTGMRQRLRVACAAVHRPPVLILDEPAAGLDVVASAALRVTIRQLRAEGAAVVYSTHGMDEAAQICDRLAILHQGRIRVLATPAALVERLGVSNLAQDFLKIIAGTT